MWSGSTFEALRDKSSMHVIGFSWIFTFYNINFLNKALYQIVLCCFHSINDNWNKCCITLSSFFFLRQDLKYLAPVFLSQGLVESCRGNTHLWSIYSTSADKHYIHSSLKGGRSRGWMWHGKPIWQNNLHGTGDPTSTWDVRCRGALCVKSLETNRSELFYYIYANLYFYSSLCPRDTAPLTILYNEQMQFLCFYMKFI